MTRRPFFAAALLVLSCDPSRTSGDAGTSIESDNPTVPTGFDAYRQWDRWPYLRVGTRTVMRSTYDRAGGNEGADSSHFLRVTPTRAVALDLEGSGVLSFARYNHSHGSPWHYVVDGHDTAVEEADANGTSLQDDPTFVPDGVFPNPLAWTSSITHGADVIGVPIEFERSLEIDYEHTIYGTGYFIVQLFPRGARNVSRPIATWSPGPPPRDVVDLVSKAADENLAPADALLRRGSASVPPNGAITLFDASGPGVLRELQLTVPAVDAMALGEATLRLTWDDRATPSIEAPVALFFGTGSLYNRASKEYLVKAFPVSVRFAQGNVTLATRFPMPFFRHAHVELVGRGAAVPHVAWEARTVPYGDPSNWVGYLHATYVDHGAPTPGVDLTLLDTTRAEGGGDWCGQVVGTSFVFSDRGNLTTLEGDPRFFFDDSQTPQVQGTGTEEWGGGGDYWELGQTTTLPFYGHPVGAPATETPQTPDDAIESAYRFLLADLMPFGRNARVRLEHGATDDSVEHYRTVAYWYGAPGACLVPTDSLHVGDEADEAAHRYVSPTASPIDRVSSRYEWGVDHVADALIYPETEDSGRHMAGTSEFSLTIRPKNLGVLLRRKLDYSYMDQRAEVFIADDSPGSVFADAGPWYLAGSNACVYSSPASEPPAIQPTIEVSNRRWRDDEFLVPRAMTEGRSAIRVRIVFSPRLPAVSLTPDGGSRPATSAWSEFRYTAYVWSLPGEPL
jgi:hypothetical protein